MLARAHLRADKASGSSSSKTIINLPSAGVHLPYGPNNAAYGCSKIAMAKITEYLYYENP